VGERCADATFDVPPSGRCCHNRLRRPSPKAGGAGDSGCNGGLALALPRLQVRSGKLIIGLTAMAGYPVGPKSSRLGLKARSCAIRCRGTSGSGPATQPRPAPPWRARPLAKLADGPRLFERQVDFLRRQRTTAATFDKVNDALFVRREPHPVDGRPLFSGEPHRQGLACALFA
jgi:hypothetical protein